jgi:hypothetical protein
MALVMVNWNIKGSVDVPGPRLMTLGLMVPFPENNVGSVEQGLIFRLAVINLQSIIPCPSSYFVLRSGPLDGSFLCVCQ